jgi:hypothetical protein
MTVLLSCPALEGNVLPQSVLEEWQASPRSLEDWNPLFDASQRVSVFGSVAKHEARL